MSNLRSLSSRQKKTTREMPLPMYNKNITSMKHPATQTKNQPEKSKMTIGDAIGLITIRLGKVEQLLIDLNMNDNYLNSSPPVIDQNQNMNTSEEHLILLNSSLERIQKIENTTKNIDKFDTDLRDTKDLLIKLVAKQEKNLSDQEIHNTNIYTFINHKVDELVETKVNELVEKRVNDILNTKVDELVTQKVNELLKKTADEIVSKNVDDIINIRYNDSSQSSIAPDDVLVNETVELSE